ncbi:ribosome silencing factor [Egicoccus sp. AB-alg2]|uniref:ribosome silencing factor n=1 Tax=Egicoccus sp. AB-alg2 TaxID=3242693 RepID=UPI00359E0DE4
MPATDEAVALAVAAADAADDKKASDLTILEVADLLALVDVFLLVSTSSDRQLKAVAESVEERLRVEHERKPLRREGTAEGGWLVIDYGDLVCHLFSTEEREFYALDKLWADVPRRDPGTGERLDGAPARISAGSHLGDEA